MSDSWLELVQDPSPWTAPSPLPEVVQTPRLLVRLYERGDGPALYRAISAHREALLPWMPWARTDHQDEHDSVYFVEKERRACERSDCRAFRMTIVERETGEIVGGTGLEDIRQGTLQAEIGYWVRGDRQRRGYCLEAVGALISAAFRPTGEGGWGLRRIVICCSAENEGSRGVCEALGLRLEGRFKRERYLGPVDEGQSGYHDILGYGVLADEWDAEAHQARLDIERWDWAG